MGAVQAKSRKGLGDAPPPSGPNFFEVLESSLEQVKLSLLRHAADGVLRRRSPALAPLLMEQEHVRLGQRSFCVYVDAEVWPTTRLHFTSDMSSFRKRKMPPGGFQELQEFVDYCLERRTELIDSQLARWRGHLKKLALAETSATASMVEEVVTIVVNGLAGPILEVGSIECPTSWTVEQVKWEIAKRMRTGPHTFRLVFRELTLGQGQDLGLDCPMSKLLEIAGSSTSAALTLTLIKIAEKYTRYQAGREEAVALHRELKLLKSGSLLVPLYCLAKMRLTEEDFKSEPLTVSHLKLQEVHGPDREHQVLAKPQLRRSKDRRSKEEVKPYPVQRKHWKAHQVGRSQQRKP